MSRWKKIQKELIKKSIWGEKLDLVEQEVSSGKVVGTVWYKKNTSPKKGVVLIHGMMGNRHVLATLAKRLAEGGFLCLSIDLPHHYKNPLPLTLGNLSEEITESVKFIKYNYGVNKVAIIGHSLGAIGALFSCFGYNNEIEKSIYQFWEALLRLVEYESVLAEKKDFKTLSEVINKAEEVYDKMKLVILYSLKKRISEGVDVGCYILLSPPSNIKISIPGMSLLRNVEHKKLKPMFEFFLHKHQVRMTLKEGNLTKYVPEKDQEYFNWLFFKTKDIHSFMEYMSKLNEPFDFITLIEKLIKLKHVDQKVGFFEYYYNKYFLSKPKLFVYGMRDLTLMPFLPWKRNRLENFYKGCGNAQIIRGSFSHSILENEKQQVSSIAMDNSGITEMIMMYLDKYI